MIYSDLEVRAAKFAEISHRGTPRKYSTSTPLPPYIIHPAAVADIVRSVVHTEEMLAAAWLHDVVEDCDVSPTYLEREFGRDVCDLVMWLSDITVLEDGNRAFRVEKNRAHSCAGPAESQTIKMADIIHNSYRICNLAPKFAPVYWGEKKLLVEGLTAADPLLHDFHAAMRGNGLDNFRFEHASPETLYLALP